MEGQSDQPNCICSNCKSSNPAGKKYCGDCGIFLDAAIGPIKNYLDTNLREQILTVLKENYKDQKILESEIAANVATKLSDWGKLFAYFLAIPLGTLIIILGIFGVKNYLDFTNLVAEAKSETEQRVKDARKEGESITNDYQSLRNQLAQATGLANDVKALSEKIDQISEKIGFEPSTALTSTLKSQLETSLLNFQRHLREIGYKGTEAGVKIHINPKIVENGPAFYKNGTIEVESPFAADADILFREYSHHVLLNSKNENLSGGSFGFVALESGLASYFSSSYNDDPKLGEQSIKSWEKRSSKEAAKDLVNRGYVHNLKNDRTFEELKTNGLNSNYVGAEVWGGLFWDIRELLGKDKADKLIFQTWQSLQLKYSETDLQSEFYNQFIEAIKSLEGEGNLNQITEIFKKRGLPF